MMGLNQVNLVILISFQIIFQAILLSKSQRVTNIPPVTPTPKPEYEPFNSTSEYQFRCDTPPSWFTKFPTIDSSRLWPNGRVTYQFSSSVTEGHADYIAMAVQEFNKKTCIRFEPRYDVKQLAFLNFEYDPDVCALAQFCYKGSYQYIRFNKFCGSKAVIIHLLGHALCLPHEHERLDRDDYVDFSHCPKDEVPQKHHFDTKGYPYDFSSQMHFQCGGCTGGKAKLEGVRNCGLDVTSKLSVLDADKINELYGCQGCYRHRWRSTDNLSELDKRAMIPFGYHHHDNQPMYLCRAFINGDISPGTYRLDHNLCYVPFQKNVYHVKEHVQVFALPPPNSTAEALMPHGTYKTVPTHFGQPIKFTQIPIGMTFGGVIIYAAMATVTKYGIKEKAIGKVYGDVPKYAYIPFEDKVLQIADFDVLVCTMDP